jgi:RNA polymerase sigma-70 factor, ECF subfamily
MKRASEIAELFLLQSTNVDLTRRKIQPWLQHHAATAFGTHIEDVILATEASFGDPVALQRLDTTVFLSATRKLLSKRMHESVVDDAVQQCRISLLVNAEQKHPAIWNYVGRGPLAAFVFVSSYRFALKLLPDRRQQDVSIDLLRTNDADPGIEHLRKEYGSQIREAILHAWRHLSKHDRFVLSLQLHGAQSIAQIAVIYGIHKVSVARKIAGARASLLAKMRLQLQGRLGAADETIDSILRLVSRPVSVSDFEPATGVREALARS